MPEVEVERKPLLEIPLRLDKEKQIPFPIPGDILVPLIGVDFCFQPFQPFLTRKDCRHIDLQIILCAIVPSENIDPATLVESRKMVYP
jgi:hypothetical protein